MKQFRARRLVPNIFGFEKVEHAEEVNRILAGRALINICAKRDSAWIELPRLQPLVTHAAMTRLVISPARGIVNPLPGQNVRECAQNYAPRFDRPNLIQMTDRRAELQLHSFTIGISRINYVGPVKTARPEARVARRALGTGKRL